VSRDEHLTLAAIMAPFVLLALACSEFPAARAPTLEEQVELTDGAKRLACTRLALAAPPRTDEAREARAEAMALCFPDLVDE
jgi:hypothetical protein